MARRGGATSGSRTRARARLVRCASPPERKRGERPASGGDTEAIEPFGSAALLVSPAERHAADRPERTLPSTVVSSRSGSWKTSGHAPAVAQEVAADVCAIEEHPAAPRALEERKHLEERALTGAVRTKDGEYSRPD